MNAGSRVPGWMLRLALALSFCAGGGLAEACGLGIVADGDCFDLTTHLGV